MTKIVIGHEKRYWYNRPITVARPQTQRKGQIMAKAKNNQTGGDTQDIDDGFQYEVSHIVTVPQLKLVDDIAVFICFDGPIISQEKKTKNGPALDEEGNPLSISTAKVINLKTSEIQSIVCGAAMVDNIKDAYPNNGYVGKCFRLVKTSVAGKRWKGYDIREIKDPR